VSSYFPERSGRFGSDFFSYKALGSFSDWKGPFLYSTASNRFTEGVCRLPAVTSWRNLWLSELLPFFPPLSDSVGSQNNSLAFTHVNVMDATGQPALPDRTVIVAADRIQTIGKFSEAKLPKGAKAINANGKYMIPGLWDMHVHFGGGSRLIPDSEAWVSIFLTNGITGIREMGGDISETVFLWRT